MSTIKCTTYQLARVEAAGPEQTRGEDLEAGSGFGVDDWAPAWETARG